MLIRSILLFFISFSTWAQYQFGTTGINGYAGRDGPNGDSGQSLTLFAKDAGDKYFVDIKIPRALGSNITWNSSEVKILLK